MPLFLHHIKTAGSVWLAACLLLCECGFFPSSVQAGVGNAETKRQDDLLLLVDYRWAGTVHGGYYPIRIRVSNAGPACELAFRFEPYEGQQLPVVERRGLPLGQDDTTEFTLSIPMVGQGASGRLEVQRDGIPLDQLTTQIRLADVDYNPPRPSLLIISPNEVATATMERGIKILSGGEMSYSDDHQVLPPVMLPDSWLDYTGLDIVLIPLETLSGLASDERTALLEWAQSGGTLAIYSVGAPAGESPELQKLLNLSDSDWTAADLRRRNFSIPDREEHEHHMPGFRHNPGGPHHREEHQQLPEFPWPEIFERHDYLLGQVYAFSFDPFPGSIRDWAWWVGTLPIEARTWEARHGVLPRRSNPDFFNFLIPGVTSVPVYAFLVLMTLFTIVIGPLNYFLLRRRKRTYLLLLTIPAIAFVTSLTLFAYSTLAYGFDVASRIRSLTVLDQRTNTAVSFSRISLFAGLAPSGGMTFSPDTAVYPIWPIQFDGGSGFEAGRVIWGEQQELADGWLRSRTRTQFATVQHRTERGRLEIGEASGSKLPVSNGLEWDILALVLMDENGTIYQGETLGAGNSGELARVRAGRFGELGGFVSHLRQYPLELPDDLATKKRSPVHQHSRHRRGRGRYEPMSYAIESGGMMETKFAQFKEISTRTTLDEVKAILPPRSYLAILAERPGIELGVEETDERASLHVLWGRY